MSCPCITTRFYATHTGITGSDLNNSTGTTAPLISWLDGSAHDPLNSTMPKAFINWVFMDEQFNTITGSMTGCDAVSANNNVLKNHHQTISITRNGYLYVYCSNESDLDVFFDNLQIIQTHGPLIEETHYYPFGLTMAGISSKALNFGDPGNKRKYNEGTELNTDFDLGWYETSYRNYDPQIGRFIQLDALGELDYNLSPYVFASNNPILRNDPLGLKDTAVNENNPNVLQPVTVSATIKKSVGQPGTLESLIPIWGSGRAAIDDFQNGRWGWGIFNTVLAITDVFLVKSAVTGAGKLIAKAIYKSAAEEIVRTNTQRITLSTIRSLTRETLMEQVTNPKLKSVIDQLYRPGAKIGSGSTADQIRIIGDAGHIEKGLGRIQNLQNLINSGELKGFDLDIAVQLRDDLIHAVSTVK